MSDPAHKPDDQIASPPLFGSWRNAYLTVVAAFIVDVALFYAFSRYFS